MRNISHAFFIWAFHLIFFKNHKDIYSIEILKFLTFSPINREWLEISVHFNFFTKITKTIFWKPWIFFQTRPKIFNSLKWFMTYWNVSVEKCSNLPVPYFDRYEKISQTKSCGITHVVAFTVAVNCLTFWYSVNLMLRQSLLVELVPTLKTFMGYYILLCLIDQK